MTPPPAVLAPSVALERLERYIETESLYPAEKLRLREILATLRASLAQQGEGKPVAWFPLLGTPFAIRRSMLNEQQAMRNHSQTLDRLAQRGGLGPEEARANVDRMEWRRIQPGERDAFIALIEAHKVTHPAAVDAGDGESAMWALRQILHDLPTRRDWLCPDVEKVARAIVARNPYADLTAALQPAATSDGENNV